MDKTAGCRFGLLLLRVGFLLRVGNRLNENKPIPIDFFCGNDLLVFVFSWEEAGV